MLTLWNGFDRNLHNELRKMDRMLDHALWPAFATPRTSAAARPATMAWPRVDVVEDDDALRLVADVPGMKADDIDITLHEGVLVIEGKTHEEKEEKEEKADGDQSDEAGPRYLFRERRDLSFKRSFKLGRDLDGDNVSASVDNGVLTVVLPKVAKPVPRQIKVTTK
ncbi:MAG TPA: Hsp20/alpha crystallin family protein [Polyangiaceae bacterium]|nr:Hsp20/alpha crystallin family protein [Polyangiaceae bacterium]